MRRLNTTRLLTVAVDKTGDMGLLGVHWVIDTDVAAIGFTLLRKQIVIRVFRGEAKSWES